ncbi:MAG: glycerol-3-phosphate acyltransferase PlsY [Candidatus Tokpelaia sp. JSC188]|nr:MAG: glycerol-3-phosphate acyltransferase PlsY [Candidatus Tokpelaia sp. JSC188]
MLPLNIEVIDSLWLGISVAIAYLIGSVPFGLIFTRFAGLGDIRAIGSGNTGATNVLRTGNWKIAIFTLLCDMLKGLLVMLVFSVYGQTLEIIAGFFAFVGHIFPVWLGFKGGKGVATYLGVLSWTAWPYAVIFGLVWFITVVITRYSSFSALVATITVAVFAFLSLSTTISGIIILMSIIVVLKHHTNIQRLCRGTENKIGEKLNKVNFKFMEK